MSKRERRFLQSEVTVSSDESPKITGYAAVFNKRSHLLGDFVEEIDPHAFDKCLANNPDIKGLINHDDNQVLGRTASGTMKVSVDAVGLKYEIDPPNTTYANDLLVSMRRKDIEGSSFGFYAKDEVWSYDRKNNLNVRRIIEADVFDCSVATNGAYPDASSQVRSLFPDDKGSIPETITEKIAELRTTQRKQRNLRSVMGAVAGTAWAILPEKLEAICGVLNARATGDVATKEEIRAIMMGQDQQLDSEPESGVAVLPIYGTIGHKMNMMTEFSGGFSCEQFTKQFRAALADDTVSAIVFDVDSPGGTVTGVPELAAEIRAARGKKPIVAVANGMAASAAYWLASAADKLVMIPSGKVGSIGVYTTHQDVSAAMDKAGVKVTFIQAAKYKTEGNPYEPLSESAKDYIQKDVDAIYEDFVAAVAAGRGVSADKVKSDYGQGRVLMAKDALATGMVDSVQTLDEVVAELAQSTYTVTSITVSDPSASIVADQGPEDEPIDPALCKCTCAGCTGGNCADCDQADCDWEDGDMDGCDCGFDEDDEDDDMDLKNQTPGVVAASGIKTKRVDGEDLEKSAFAYQGSDEIADWKLPIEFSTDEKSKSHVENAIARWPDTDMPNAAEKDKARERIKDAADKHGIKLAPGDLASVLSPEQEANLNAALKVKLMGLYA